MRNTFYKGENILVRWSVMDKFNQPINYTDLMNVTVKVTDRQGNSVTFSKIPATGNSSITAGVQANEYEFELTEAMTSAFSGGKLVSRFTYKIPSADHAAGYLIDIIEEGVNSEFITLQE